ncbi:hypothetical protein MPTK1_4g00290 [Marchantia polymorpha subsp. ruderalis]|uniref:Uncharacterized protein n=2 Tax=Marchantia polymorpha TaxID=3197 RepID=A0AAF6B4T6_MARPO|nr:hypothetical protein MARPO_0066s0112 [Marchantia polymorpha]BBN07020.1 hypothetical protein Mp_4g00290 [Marchantia polymorpha subsp. ruderalis]|eukprot:PTQ36164.1 hypothetical protein MARPO_0066s0112 [Marchantia polymorpha]
MRICQLQPSIVGDSTLESNLYGNISVHQPYFPDNSILIFDHGSSYEGQRAARRMNSEQEASTSEATYKPLPFVEVWSPDGSVRRFAAGTKARFALERINSKIGESNMRVVMIESVKAGEQTVEFGPDAELVSYGKGWRLRAVPDQSNCKVGLNKRMKERRFPPIDRKKLVILHRRNMVNWDNTDLSSKWSWPTETDHFPSQKQMREQVFVGASFAERNSILRKIYGPSSYTPRRSYSGEKS